MRFTRKFEIVSISDREAQTEVRRTIKGTIPERKTFTMPAQLKGEDLEEAGIHIVYGPNSVPPPEGISEEAKAMWRQLPQVPLQGHDHQVLVDAIASGRVTAKTGI